jgi:hypothetical protein
MLRFVVLAALVAVSFARLSKTELDEEWQLFLKQHGKQYEAEEGNKR